MPLRGISNGHKTMTVADDTADNWGYLCADMSELCNYPKDRGGLLIVGCLEG